MKKVIQFSLFLWLTLAAGAQTQPASSQPPSSLGGKTVTSSMNDTDQMVMNGAFGVQPGDVPGQMVSFRNTYNAKDGFPVLNWLGLNTSSFTSSEGFRGLFWGLLYLAVCISMGRAMLTAFKKGNPIPEIGMVFFKIIVGMGIISLRGTIYSLVMTIAVTCSNIISTLQKNAILPSAIQNANTSSLQFENARKDAIDEAVSRRAQMLYPDDVSLADEITIASTFNALAGEANTIVSNGNRRGLVIPTVDTTTQPNEDQSHQIDRLGRFMMKNIYPLVQDYSTFAASAQTLTLNTPNGSMTIQNLGSLLQNGPEMTRAKALTLPNTPDWDGAYQADLDSYKKSVSDITGGWMEQNLIQQGVLGHAWSVVKEKADELYHKGTSLASMPFRYVQQAISALANGIGYVCTKMVGFVFMLGVRVLIEVNLFLLIVMFPTWFMPSWQKAFPGCLKGIIALMVMVPAFQMLMLFADAIMAALLRLIMLGPTAMMTSTVASTVDSALYVGSMIFLDPWGYISMIVGYTIGYLAFACYMAKKTPSIVTKALSGAGAAGAIVSTWATGWLSTGLGAVAMAAAASGGPVAGYMGRALKPANFMKSLAADARSGDGGAGASDGTPANASAGAGQPAGQAVSHPLQQSYAKRKKSFAIISKKQRTAAEVKSAPSPEGAAPASEEIPSASPAMGARVSRALSQGVMSAAMGLGRIARHAPQHAARAFTHTRDGPGSTFSNYVDSMKDDHKKKVEAAAALAEEAEQALSSPTAVVQRQAVPVQRPASARPNIPGRTTRELRQPTSTTRTPKQQATAAAYNASSPQKTAAMPSKPSIPKRKAAESAPNQTQPETAATPRA